MSTRDVQDLLYEGESVEQEVDFGSNRVVVTDRRVLTFRSGASGQNYRHVERPNVLNVAVRTRTDRSYIWKSLTTVVLGVVLAAAGLLVDTDGLFSVPSTAGGRVVGGAGAGGFVSSINRMVGYADNALLVGGLVFLLFGVFFVVRYVRDRNKVVAIDVSGESDIDIPIEKVDDARSAVEKLRLALDISLDRGETEGGPEWSATR